MWFLSTLAVAQICTIPNKTEVTATGEYFCVPGGSSLYSLDDFVQVQANRDCESEDDAPGAQRCLCNFNDHKPQTLLPEILEGVSCVSDEAAQGIPLSEVTMAEIQRRASRLNPYQVTDAQCNETFQCLAVTATSKGHCQPILPVPAFNDTGADDRLYLYPVDGSRHVQSASTPPCDCHDQSLVFASLSEGGPNEVCHDTVVGWKWAFPPPGIEPTLPIMDPGPEVEVEVVERTGSPCRMEKEGQRSCGVESRSPPDSVPIGDACKNSMPFLERLSPGRQDYDLNLGLTFLRAACAADQQAEEGFWVDELVDQFASAPLSNWSDFLQEGKTATNKLDKQWLTLMYAINLEYGAINLDKLNPADGLALIAPSGQTVIEMARLQKGPTLQKVFDEFVEAILTAGITQDELSGRAKDQDYTAVLNDPIGWSECCASDINGDFNPDPSVSYQNPTVGLANNSRCLREKIEDQSCADDPFRQSWHSVKCEVKSACGSLITNIYMSSEYSIDVSSDEQVNKLIQVVFPSRYLSHPLKDGSTLVDSFNRQLNATAFLEAVNKRVQGDSALFWLNPTWWLDAPNSNVRPAWELNDLKLRFSDLKGSPGGIIYKVPTKGYTQEETGEDYRTEKIWAEENFDGATEQSNGEYVVPARGLSSSPYCSSNTNGYCKNLNNTDWNIEREKTINAADNANFTRQQRNSPIRLARFGGIYSLGYDLPGDTENLLPWWGCRAEEEDVCTAFGSGYRGLHCYIFDKNIMPNADSTSSTQVFVTPWVSEDVPSSTQKAKSIFIKQVLSTRPICASGLHTYNDPIENKYLVHNPLLAVKHQTENFVGGDTCGVWKTAPGWNPSTDITLPPQAHAPFSANIYGDEGYNGPDMILPGTQSGPAFLASVPYYSFNFTQQNYLGAQAGENIARLQWAKSSDGCCVGPDSDKLVNSFTQSVSYPPIPLVYERCMETMVEKDSTAGEEAVLKFTQPVKRGALNPWYSSADPSNFGIIWQDFELGSAPPWTQEANHYTGSGIDHFIDQGAQTLLSMASARGLLVPLERLVPSMFSSPEFILGIDDILDTPDQVEAECDDFFKPGLKRRIYGEAPFYVDLDGSATNLVAFARKSPKDEELQAAGVNIRTVLMPSPAWNSLDAGTLVGGSVTVDADGNFTQHVNTSDPIVQSLYRIPDGSPNPDFQAVFVDETDGVVQCSETDLSELIGPSKTVLTWCFKPDEVKPTIVTVDSDFVVFRGCNQEETFKQFSVIYANVPIHSPLKSILQVSGLVPQHGSLENPFSNAGIPLRLEAVNGTGIYVRRTFSASLSNIATCSEQSCVLTSDMPVLIAPGVQADNRALTMSYNKGETLKLILPFNIGIEMDMLKAYNMRSQGGGHDLEYYVYDSRTPDTLLVGPDTLLQDKVSKARVLNTVQKARRNMPESSLLGRPLVHVTEGHLQGPGDAQNMVYIDTYRDLGGHLSARIVSPTQYSIYFTIFSQNSQFGAPVSQDNAHVSFSDALDTNLQLTFQKLTDADFDLFVAANTMDLPALEDGTERNASWAWYHDTFIDLDESSSYDNSTQTLTVGSTAIPVKSPIFFGTSATSYYAKTYFGQNKTYDLALDKMSWALDHFYITGAGRQYLYLHHGLYAPVIAESRIQDIAGLTPAQQQEPFLQALLYQATAFYRTNLIYGLRPGISTAFYDTKNGGETRSVVFPRWDLQQCENVTILGVAEQTKTQTAERPEYVDPNSPIGLTQAQLNAWCQRRANCSDPVSSASCVPSGGSCTGKDPKDFNCEQLISDEDPVNSKDCLANPYCTITRELEDKVGIRLGGLVLVSAQEQALDGVASWQYYCRPFTHKIQLDATNAKDMFAQGKLPLLRCGSEEECETPPENFVGLTGTDSFNTRTTLANEFWINYFDNYPMFGASYFTQIAVTNLGNSTGNVDAFVRSNGVQSVEKKCATDGTSCVPVQGERLPNCGPGDAQCSFLVDDIFFCPCERTKQPSGWPTCTKPLTQFYTPDMFTTGSPVYAGLYNLDTDVWPSYQSCKIYSFAGDTETRDIPQWLASQLNDPRVIQAGARPEQLHYCDKIDDSYGFCLNDAYTLSKRKAICEEKYGRVGVKGKTVHTVDDEGLMCHGTSCVIMHGPGRFGSVPAVLEWIKANNKPYRTIRVAPLSQQFLRLVLFDATSYDTVFSANYTDEIDAENAFTANQIDLENQTLFLADATSSMCGATKDIRPVLAELRRYYEQLNRFQDKQIELVTADHDYPPDEDDFVASLTTAQAEGYYTANGAIVEDGFTIESFFDDFWPTFQLSGESCLAFNVVGEDVTLKNLRFDQSLCSPKPGYEYHQIPVICPGPSCARARLENLEMVGTLKTPLIGFLGASGVDGRAGATAVAEVDVAGAVIKNVSASTYLVAAARSIGTFQIDPANKDDDCNKWAAATSDCRTASLANLMQNQSLIDNNIELTASGYLVMRGDGDATKCGSVTKNKLVFETCDKKAKFVLDPYLHLRGDPFFCFSESMAVQICPPCAVGYGQQFRPSGFASMIPECKGSQNYQFSINGVSEEKPYYCGVQILSCVAEVDRLPHGALYRFDKSATTPGGGIGAVLTAEGDTVVETDEKLSLGGFGYSYLLDKGVSTKGVLIEPNDADFAVNVNDPTLDVVNISYYTGLFGKNYLNIVYAERPISKTFYIIWYIVLSVVLLILIAVNIVFAEQLEIEESEKTEEGASLASQMGHTEAIFVPRSRGSGTVRQRLKVLL